LRCSDAQVRKLMEEYSEHGRIELAGLRAGMDRKTAAKYVKAGKLPSDLVKQRHWRTRADPFDAVWPGIAQQLSSAPELEARILFEDLLEREPGKFQPGQLRTFQRRVKQWRAQDGPDKRVFFSQLHRPGEAAQTDFTWATELKVTINGEEFPHMLCHFVLPYSNWEWATVCHSESIPSLKHGIQSAVFRLGRTPEYHQTDHSTAATHNLSKLDRKAKKEEDGSQATRGFNEEYLGLMRHLGLKPRTTQVGEKEQNGDVEALNGALKRRLLQHLLLRGSRDFLSVQDYELWLHGIIEKSNAQRSKRVAEELDAMTILRVERLAEFQELDVLVTTWGTIRVKRNAYSVPSRLIGERVRVRVHEDKLDVYHGGVHQLTCERLRGEGGSRINYRHIIWSLVQKPGAFERYRYREDLFPSLSFRKSYDALCAALTLRKADVEYLSILNLAAKTMESKVDAALELLLKQGKLPLSLNVKELIAPERPEVPELPQFTVDLCAYDALLGADAEELQEVPS